MATGVVDEGEGAPTVALREAGEELGIDLADRLEPLATVRQAGGRTVEAFALERRLGQ